MATMFKVGDRVRVESSQAYYTGRTGEIVEFIQSGARVRLDRDRHSNFALFFKLDELMLDDSTPFDDEDEMPLYTRKNGEFVKLTPDQLRRFRRTSQVLALQVSARHLTTRVRAVATWLDLIVARTKFMGSATPRILPTDFSVSRLPDVRTLRSLADAVDKHEKELHRC